MLLLYLLSCTYQSADSFTQPVLFCKGQFCFLFNVTTFRVKVVRYEMVSFLSPLHKHTHGTLAHTRRHLSCVCRDSSALECAGMCSIGKERSEQYCWWLLMNSSSPGHTDTHTQTHSPAETAWHIALITWCIYCLLPMSLSNSWPIAGLHAGPFQHLSCPLSEGVVYYPKNPSMKLSAHSSSDMSMWKNKT